MKSFDTDSFIWGAYTEAIITILLLMIFFHPASALYVNDIIITPNTTIMAGQPASASFGIILSPYQRYTMNPENSLVFSSSLDNPEWTNTFILEGVKGAAIPQTTNVFTLEGWQLAYPLGVNEHILTTISGTAPNVPSSTTIQVFSVAEHDNAGIEIKGSGASFGLLVIAPGDISYIISEEEKHLQDLKDDIVAAKEAHISGSTAAETLYQQAATGIAYLKTLKPEEYETAVQRANEINAAIQGAEDMLSRATVQKEIDRATVPINQTSIILEWFSQNPGIKDYPGLSNVSEQYQQSQMLLTRASTEMNHGQWDAAGADAKQAYITGNQTLYAANALFRRASDPLTPLWDNIWIVYVIIIGGAVYVIFFRKKKMKKKVEKKPVEDVK